MAEESQPTPRPSASGPASATWRPGARDAIELSVVAGAFVAMLAFTWGTWLDPMVDFGNELYHAWRLTEGAVLGRDVAVWATGSLSPYVNAALFATFGVGLRTLVVANLVLLVAVTALLWILLRELAGRTWATAATLVFLLAFGFGEYTGIGNYNYVTPYSHGATHGILLALAAVALRWRFARTGAVRHLAGASLCLGLVFLTKPEIFVAAAGAAIVDLVLQLRARPAARARVLLASTLPALVPAAVSLVALSIAAGPAVARDATFSPWIAARTPLVRIPFYVVGLGLDAPLRNLARAAGWLAAGTALLVPAAILDVRVGRHRHRWLLAGAASAALAFASWTWGSRMAPFVVPRALPLAVLVGGALVLASAWRRGRSCPPALALHAGLATFAGLLLLKMGLNARIFHYGFALAMPATLLVVVWLGASVPRAVRARGGSGIVFQAVVATALVFFVGACVRRTASRVASVPYAVAGGADAFRADRRGAIVNAILADLAAEHRRDATLAVLPEGVMINYLARRASPTPFPSYMPDALALKGEPALLAPLVAHPPEHVVIASRDTAEFGARVFGDGYAAATWRWLSANYVVVRVEGGSPFNPREYGMMLLRRRERVE